MVNRIFPNWEQLNNLKVSLTDGERTLANYFDKYLPKEWEIYIQPYFNGDRPDIVLLNPHIGIMVYEVKDWNLNLYWSEKYTRKNNNKIITFYKSFVRDQTGNSQPVVNPVKQVERYRSNLLRYMPQIADSIDANKKKLGVFRMGLYFHTSTTEQAKRFIPNHKEKNCILVGQELLLKEDIFKIVPDVNRDKSYYMEKSWADSIRFWLKPPYHSMEQEQKIDLSPEQKKHINPSSHKHQRLRGVAGSGKTLVIAQRAANLASQGKKVLIVTFNITLWHYIRDAVSRARYGFEWERIEFNHFHGFCRNFLMENNIVVKYNEEDDYFDETIPNLVMSTLNQKKNCKNRIYDAVLIDEGQDYAQSYYDVLCAFLSDNDEVLFVTDEKQNIYSRELSWIDKMSGTKFKGRWRELNKSYRLPLLILREANRFAKLFLPKVGIVAEPVDRQTKIGVAKDKLINSHLLWRNLHSYDKYQDKIFDAYTWLTEKKNIHPSEIVILVSTHKEGMKLVERFKKNSIKVNHVFEGDKSTYKNKHSFWMGDGRLKISTIHSFKGWELLNVIVLTPYDDSNKNIDYLMYIAITRARENLIVFNRLDKYTAFGESWSGRW